MVTKGSGVDPQDAGWKFLARLTGGILGKLEEFGENTMKTRGAIPEIALISIACWVLKGFEWYFLGLSIGITQIGWLGFFFMHPLITAFGFVPLTPIRDRVPRGSDRRYLPAAGHRRSAGVGVRNSFRRC